MINDSDVFRMPAYILIWDLDLITKKALCKIRTKQSVLLIDMSEVKNVFSSTLKLLVRLSQRAKNMGCEIFITNVSERVLDSLMAQKIDQFVSFKVSDDLLTVRQDAA